MRHFDQSSAVCHVFTYKEGLLSTFAYDLRISVASFTVELGEDEHFIDARFDASSLHVDCAMVNGAERQDILSTWEKETIDRNIIRDVLNSDTYRDILLSSSSVTREDSTYFVKASLTLHGTTRSVSFTVRTENGYHVAEVWLHLPDFGIKPFSAFLGTIKLKPDILIRAMIPAD